MWQDILKVQVLDTTTSLSSINEPMVEDRNCCEKAKEEYLAALAGVMFDYDTGKFIKPSSTYWNKDYGSEIRDIFRKETEDFIKLVREEDCERFKHEIKPHYNSKHPQQIEEARIVKEILANWEECENE